MAQKEIEVILTRQLASYLALPVFIVNMEGTLVFYNEPAEAVLGRRYEESGEMPLEELAKIFKATDKKGVPLPPETLPIYRALKLGETSHCDFWIRGLDKVLRHIEVTAFPVVGLTGQRL